MKIVVLIKEVPDTGEERLLNLETGLADRAGSEAVLDEIGERAIEVALKYATDHPDTEITALTMGPESAHGTLRKALAMGAHHAVHIHDEQLIGADLVLTAETLAAALRQIGFDLIVTGNVSTDGGGGVLPALLAEILDIPAAMSLSTVTIEPDKVSGKRDMDGASANINATLPAVISVTEALPEGRFPNFKSIMAAKKKTIETFSLADLGVDPLPEDTARSIMVAVAQRPPRAAGTIITDEGEAGRSLATFLVENKLA